MTELRQLAGFAVNFRLEQAPEEVVRAAKYCVLDSIGSAWGRSGTRRYRNCAAS